ncbi:MAG: methyltransferase domain-containing protein [Thermaerobacter sp.]|nr:methyltransferase domain-containing protein [Thermaerobacter sp.]
MMREDPSVIKQCCAAAYATPWVALLLGESWHPGGLDLTEHLGRALALTPRDVVADVAAGEGASARHLAARFGCEVWALDLGEAQVARGQSRDARQGGAPVRFQQGDAEALPWAAGSVDVVLCECALCTFPSPETAVQEWARVVKPGGRIGLTDVTRRGPLPAALDNLAGWVGCLAGARPVEAYADLLTTAGFQVLRREDRSADLSVLVARIGQALLTWLQFQGPGASLGGLDRAAVEGLWAAIQEAIGRHELGYALLTARRPA